MKVFILALILSSSVHAQFDAAANTLQNSGWMNSHYKAYQYAPQRAPAYNSHAETMRLYREAATEQIRASGNFQRTPSRQVCFRTVNGIVCQ